MVTSAAETTRAEPAGGELATLVAHLHRQLRTRPDAPALRFRAGERWTTITWGHLGVASRRLMALLVDEGVEVGDHVAIWSGNRPEWHIADAAVLSLRARPVPVYLTLSAEQVVHVLGHSEARVAVVESPALLEVLLGVRAGLPHLRRVVVVEGLEAATEDGFAIPWTEALGRGDSLLAFHGAQIDRRIAASRLDDVATLIYTSGTTGPPKAVMLTHRNVAAAVASTAGLIPADAGDRILSYLPLAHIAERLNSEFRSYVHGNVTYFAPGVDRLAEHLRDVCPTIFFAVPRVWEKMADRIQGEIDRATGGRGRMARRALAVGRRAAAEREAGRPVTGLLALRLALADRLVLRRLRAALGLDAARVLATGAAPIAADVLRLLDAVGLPVLEVYGQTEGTGITTMNRPGRARIGTVGTPFPGVEVELAADGEILVRGDAVFPGYHRDGEATAEALRDGWLHTGDVGELDAEGYLRITDRKKELIITSGGKNIAPSGIETALKRHPLVSNAVVVGDRRPFVGALLTLDAGAATEWAGRRGLDAADLAALVAGEALRTEIGRHVAGVNAGLSRVEQVKRWALLPADFRVGDELTPTLKVRRKVVAERHAQAIEALYAAPGPATERS